MNGFSSSYLTPALASADSHADIVNRVVQNIQSRIPHDSYDGIVFRGVSGAIIAPVVAYLLGKPMAVVRRDKDESTHAVALVEINNDIKRYLIIDDFISSGKTVETIVAACKDLEMECVGVVCWNPTTSSWSQLRPSPARTPEMNDVEWNAFHMRWILSVVADENIFWLDHNHNIPVYCCPKPEPKK